MKKILALIAATLLSHMAHAIPVPFEIVGSTLTAVGNGIGTFSYDDNPTSFVLDDNESEAVTFGTVTALGFSSGSLSLGIDFDSPVDSVQTGSGTYDIFTFVVFNFAEVTWDGPLLVNYQYAGQTGSFRIDFDDITEVSGFPDLPVWDLTGTITNLGSTPGPAPVPEPSTLALLGFGLLGLRRAQARHRINS